LDHQSGLLDQQWAVAAAMGLLSLNGFHILGKIRTQKLPQVRMEGSLPGNGKNLSAG
jgi:hypothetical protein